MALLSEPQHAYSQLAEGRKRIYNQAWFAKIYIEAISDDVETPLDWSRNAHPLRQRSSQPDDCGERTGTKKSGPFRTRLIQRSCNYPCQEFD